MVALSGRWRAGEDAAPESVFAWRQGGAASTTADAAQGNAAQQSIRYAGALRIGGVLGSHRLCDCFLYRSG
jgi:hypothetical protein